MDRTALQNPTFITEALKPEDLRGNLFSFKAAKRIEINGLLSRHFFKKVKRVSLGPNPNIVGERFVHSSKHKVIEKEKSKARWIAQGYADKEKTFIVLKISTLRQSPVKTFVSTTAIRQYCIFSDDFAKVYLQNKDALTRTFPPSSKRRRGIL